MDSAQNVNLFREEGEIQGRTIGIYPEIKSAAATNRILAGRGEQLRSGLQFTKKILGDFLYHGFVNIPTFASGPRKNTYIF